MEVLERLRCFRPMGSFASWALRAETPAESNTHPNDDVTGLHRAPTRPLEGARLHVKALNICMFDKAKCKSCSSFLKQIHEKKIMSSFNNVDMKENQICGILWKKQLKDYKSICLWDTDWNLSYNINNEEGVCVCAHVLTFVLQWVVAQVECVQRGGRVVWQSAGQLLSKVTEEEREQ